MPQRRTKELWEQFKADVRSGLRQGQGRPRRREREVRRGREGQGGADRRGRGARRVDRLGRDRRRSSRRCRRVEGIRSPAAQAGRRAVEAVPRRVRQVLRAPQAACSTRSTPRKAQNLAEEAGADRARDGDRRRRAGEGGWGKAIGEIKELQREWKEIGFVPRRDADAVYKAFRAACDSLFAKRDAARDGEANAHRAEIDALEGRDRAMSRAGGDDVVDARDRGARQGARARAARAPTRSRRWCAT